MIRHRLFAAALVAASFVACTGIAQASPVNFQAPLHAMFSKSKMVAVNLRNDSGSPVELRVGDNVVTLASGKTQSFKLPAGTRITAASSTKNYAQGTLIAEVSSNYNGATIVLH